MTLQIKSIVLYNKNGEIRTLSFRVGKVNIITGKSGTGKSALIDILDYCLGRSEFTIPEGIIRESVAWYGLHLQLDENEIYIAKPSPGPSNASQSNCHYQFGQSITIPPLSELKLNSNDEALKKQLSGLIGISENIHTPDEGQSRDPLTAHFRHTPFYLFQNQGLIANKDLLFYRQSEDLMPLTIKDTLPYFLGAVDEDRIRLDRELRNARREYKILLRQQKENELVVSDQLVRGQALLAEAKQVGLIPEEVDTQTTDQILDQLSAILSWTPQGQTLPVVDDRTSKLQIEINELRGQFSEVCEQITAAEDFIRKSNRYSQEANAQLMRLESINLVPNTLPDDMISCPLCHSQIQNQIGVADTVLKSIRTLQDGLQYAHVEQPHISNHLNELTQKRETLREQIRSAENVLNALLQEQNAASELRDSNSRVARVIGRISLYVESVIIVREDQDLLDRLKKARDRIDYYEQLLDDETEERKQQSILNAIGIYMTDWARELKIEHSDYLFRLDPDKLTVVADRPDRPIYMARMGGGKNWLGCHLITLLALHKHFIQQRRPVPGFLVLDQPSQVYFPTLDEYRALEGTVDDFNESDADIAAVQRLFDLVFRVCGELAPYFQVIITEHANLPDPRYQEGLVESPWHSGNALIPTSWI